MGTIIKYIFLVSLCAFILTLTISTIIELLKRRKKLKSTVDNTDEINKKE